MKIPSVYITKFIQAAVKEGPKLYNNTLKEVGAEEIGEIISVHALGSAASGLASGWIPGAGGTVATIASIGFVWSMYYRINKKLNISISKTILKSLASAILTNIAGSAIALVSGTVIATVLSFTGIGNFASSLIMGALNYAVVLVSGIIYMKLLVGLFKAKNDPSAMSAEDLKSVASEIIRDEDINEMLKKASSEYKRAFKSGKVSGKENIDLEEE